MKNITTIEADLHPRDARFSIVAARFNDFVVNALIKGALSCLDAVLLESYDYKKNYLVLIIIVYFLLLSMTILAKEARR